MTASPTAERLVLSGDLTLRAIAEIHASLSNALEKASALEIDCADATAFDVSFVQLLLAARKSAAESGKSLNFTQPASPALRDVLVRLGVVSPDGDGDEEGFWLKGAVSQ